MSYCSSCPTEYGGAGARDCRSIVARSGAVDIIVIDSVAALVPRGRNRGRHVGIPTLGCKHGCDVPALRKLAGFNKSKTICIFTKSTSGKNWSNVRKCETTSGGRALKFQPRIRLEFYVEIDSIKQGNELVGNRTRIKVVKNKVAPPFKQCEVDIMYGEGISHEGSLLDIAAENGYCNKSGAWYS